MKNRTTVVFTSIALLSAASIPANAGYDRTDDYEVSQKVIPVKLQRGDQVEYGRLVYNAWVRKHERETGQPSMPLRGHPIDDRECSWQVSAHMDRQYFVSSILGGDDPIPAKSVSIPLTINGRSNGLASFLDHDPCSDYRGRINGDVEGLKTSVEAVFDEKVNEDLGIFKNETKGISVEVNP